jgi:hypothetical protein
MSLPMARLIKVLGMDPSLNNWGLAFGTYDLDTHEIVVTHVETVSPVEITGKQVRTNSKDIHRAVQLCEGIVDLFQQAQITFVEVPVGSQSAAAMKAYGICVGILGSAKASGLEFIEVTATEVKTAAGGDKKSSKQFMIQWATSTHPAAPWALHNGKLNASKVEHQADAVAAIHAGIASSPFKQLLPYLTAKE